MKKHFNWKKSALGNNIQNEEKMKIWKESYSITEISKVEKSWNYLI